MGREIKRVPLDFDWPLDKPWKGFVNPYREPCPEKQTGKCFTGATAAYKWLDSISHFISLIGKESCRGQYPIDGGFVYPHPDLKECGFSPIKGYPDHILDGIDPYKRWGIIENWYKHNTELLPLDSELLELIEGIAGFKLDPHHDCWYAIFQALIKLSGVNEETWGKCPVCKGTGRNLEFDKLYKEWEREEPPEGDGWQLWETVSEGSPVSPVFATKEEFVDYFVDQGYSKKGVENLIDRDIYCCSALIVDGKMYQNIEGCGIK